MNSKLCVLFAALLIPAGAATAQDAQSVLRAATTAMGNPTSIQYSGTGWVAAVGQSYTPTVDWPQVEVSAYTKSVDYGARASREELTRRQGGYSTRGGSIPIEGELKDPVLLANGNYAWSLVGTNVAPQPAAADVRQLDIWLTPHGFLKAAMQNNPTATALTLEGRNLTVVSFQLGKYRVNGTITDQNLVERVQTWIANPVFGDMVYEHRYTGYRDFGGVKFPTVIHSHQGDPSVNPQHNWMEIRVTDARPNVTAVAAAVPEAVRTATIPPVVVETTKLADGVWWIAGGTHHSVLVEFKDFLTVYEAPQNEARSLAVIQEVHRLVPGKPIRFVINSHNHFDHSGGLRTYVAHGATVITHPTNREFYQKVFFAPGRRSLEPDLLSTLNPWFSPDRVPQIETVSSKYTISDGERILDLYALQGLDHTPGLLVAHLPKERILVNADMYVVPTPAFQRQAWIQTMRVFYQNLQRLKLDVETDVGIHGGYGPHADFLKLMAASSQ